MIATTNPNSDLEVIRNLAADAANHGVVSFEAYLKLLFRFEGRPYSLDHHPMFEPLFFSQIPPLFVLKMARQVGKSFNSTAASLTRIFALPNFKHLFVTPLAEQARRLSHNIVKPLIDTSPIRDLMVNYKLPQNVLQRDFTNNSRVMFSYMSDNASRVRGTTHDSVHVDELQDVDGDSLPVLLETMSASLWSLLLLSGTPLTYDNPVEVYFNKTTKSEWLIPCRWCRTPPGDLTTWNIPLIDYHAFEMIGEYSEDIGPESPGIVCHRCRKPLFTRDGRWIHFDRSRAHAAVGLHIPQFVLPLHCETPSKWFALRQKINVGYSQRKLRNEVFGESYDIGAKLLSRSDMQHAAQLRIKNYAPAIPDELRTRRSRYQMFGIGADWGGGGIDETSLTAIAAGGISSSGRIDIVWGTKLYTPNDHIREARRTLEIYTAFNPNVLAHDHNGAGAMRESFLVEAGVPRQRIMPIHYSRFGASKLAEYQPPDNAGHRGYWMADKARTLQYLVVAVKMGWVRFFEYDYKDEDSPGLLDDFTKLVERKMAAHRGSDIYFISKDQSASDDFAQAVNYLCIALWTATDSWPDLADLSKFETVE